VSKDHVRPMNQLMISYSVRNDEWNNYLRVNSHPNMERRRRDLPVTIYRILLYLSRMKVREDETRRLMRIERATNIERKELRIHLNRLVESGYVETFDDGRIGRGGHSIITYDISESGRTLRSDLGRWIDLCIRLEYYPDDFFYLPSDG